jgi:hypothetical protein
MSGEVPKIDISIMSWPESRRYQACKANVHYGDGRQAEIHFRVDNPLAGTSPDDRNWEELGLIAEALRRVFTEG